MIHGMMSEREREGSGRGQNNSEFMERRSKFVFIYILILALVKDLLENYKREIVCGNSMKADGVS